MKVFFGDFVQQQYYFQARGRSRTLHAILQSED
jgi:hypothetical protein